eukprot:s1098_g6.t1
MQVEWQDYGVVAMTAHRGTLEGGHYTSLLKVDVAPYSAASEAIFTLILQTAMNAGRERFMIEIAVPFWLPVFNSERARIASTSQMLAFGCSL